MAKIDIEQIHVAPLPDLANTMFGAYMVVNNLTRDPFYQRIAERLGKATNQSDLAEITKEIYAADSTFFQGIETTEQHDRLIESLNTFFHTVSVAQEARRIALAKQQDLGTVAWLNEKRIQQESAGIIKNGEPLKLDPNDPDDCIPYGAYIPGGWAEVFFPTIDHEGKVRRPLNTDLSTTIQTLSGIENEKVITQHPTNVFSVGLNEVRGDWALSAAEVLLTISQKGEDFVVHAGLIKALQDFAAVQRVPEKNFKVMDEVRQSHHKIENLLRSRGEMISDLLNMMELGLGKNAVTPQVKLQVAKALKAKFGNWSPYDRDGNESIKTEHPLAELAEHRLIPAKHYITKLSELIPILPEESPNRAALQEKLDQLRQISTQLEDLSQDILSAEQPNGDIVLSMREFDAKAARLNEICVSTTGQDYADFAKSMEALIDSEYLRAPHTRECEQHLLHLSSNLANDGFFGAHNVSRQNSKVYDRVIGTMMAFMPDEAIRIPRNRALGTKAFTFTDWKNFGSDSIPQWQRDAVLNHLVLTRRDLLQSANKALLEHVSESGLEVSQRQYSTGNKENDDLIRTYHTVKTLELTQMDGNQDLFHRLTIADKNKVGDDLNLLALQVAVQPADESKANWQIQEGLYETIPTLLKAAETVRDSLKIDSIKKLMVKVKGNLFFFIGYSDGSKEGGSIGHVGLVGLLRYGTDSIYDFAGQTVEWAKEKVGINLTIDLGKSQLDSKRGGGGSSIAEIRTPYERAALEQGLDGPSFLNTPMGVRLKFVPEIVRLLKKTMRGLENRSTRYINARISQAATDTATSFYTEYFNSEGIHSRLLARIYPLVALFSNKSSRASNRPTEAAKSESRGASVKKVALKPVDLGSARAITASLATSYTLAIGNDNWAMADQFERNFVTDLKSNEKLRTAILAEMDRRKISYNPDTFQFFDGDQVTQDAAFALTQISDQWRQIKDRCGQSNASTDFSFLEFRRGWYTRQGLEFDLATPEDNAKMHAEYCTSARIVSYSHRKGIPEGVDVHTTATEETCRLWHDHIRSQVLPQEDRNYVEVLSRYALAIFDRVIARQEENGLDSTKAKSMLEWIHNAMQTPFGKLDASVLGANTTFERGIRAAEASRPLGRLQTAFAKAIAA